MAVFELYVPLLLNVEGGYQSSSQDAGNYNSLGQLVGTNKGISARFYEQVIKRPPTVADIKGITKQMAINIYRDYFWNTSKANQIHSQAVANTIVDHQVNAGSGVKLAQKVLNKYFQKNLSEDNSMGNQTIAALNSVDESNFVNRYNEARAAYYASLSNASTFLKGWLKRLESFAVEKKNLFPSQGSYLQESQSISDIDTSKKIKIDEVMFHNPSHKFPKTKLFCDDN